MAFFDGKGVQSVKPSERLAFIFEETQEVYKRSSASTMLTNLKLSMICDVAKPHKQFAKLDCKGAEMRHLCVALLPVIKNMLDRKQEQHKDMVSALQCMVDLIQLFDRIGIFPSSKKNTCKPETLRKDSLPTMVAWISGHRKMPDFCFILWWSTIHYTTWWGRANSWTLGIAGTLGQKTLLGK